jgi:hypothetical protein
MDNIGGYLEVGLDANNEIVVNHPDLKPDANGVGHIVFSPAQARNLAQLLLKNAKDAETATERQAEDIRIKSLPPVDRSARVLTNGKSEIDMPDYRETDTTGQQKAYVVLSPEERAKGFVRSVRRSYVHVGKLQQMENPDHPSGVTQEWEMRVGGCNRTTTMGLALAETYARDPSFYSDTFCSHCAHHFPLDQFVWKGTTEQVGS